MNVDASTELATIREARRNDPAAYDRDHNLQARELALIAERQRSERLADIAERGHDVSGLDPGLVDEWERDGGLEINYGTALDGAEIVLRNIPSADAAPFSKLSAACRKGVRRRFFGNWR
jgi:hypothetical protein